METIMFPSAVTVAVVGLEDGLASLSDAATVHGSVPNPRPERFVRVLRTGGVKQTLVSDAAQLTVEAWAGSDVESHDLAQRCRAVLHALRGTVVELPDTSRVAVYRIDEFSGPQNLPDPTSDQSRHVLTVLLHVRGAAV